MKNTYAIFTIVILALLASTIMPARAEYPADVEKRAQALEKALVAPCCWVQLDGHYSKSAEDMKAAIRRDLAGGMTEEQIIAGYVAIHGEKVRATPAAKGFDRILYILPPIALIAAAVIVFLLLRSWLNFARVAELKAKAEAPANAAPVDAKEIEILERVERELSTR